jgi:subtilisin family serine protease
LFSIPAFAQVDPWFTPADEDTALAVAARIGGDVSVSIELTDAPAAVVYGQALKNGASHGSAVGLAKKQLGQIKAAQARVRNELRKLDAQIVFETQNTFNGFGAYVKADRIAAIKAIDGVAAVHALVPQEPTNAGSVPFIGAPAAWVSGTGSNYGQGMRIGVIDTGIDYIHTNFGGPGTGYGANNTTVAGDTPGLFPGAKVAGGFDFAGDAYDAGSAVIANRTPVPDPDPMDCGGHGSHVSGSAAGFGVRAARVRLRRLDFAHHLRHRLVGRSERRRRLLRSPRRHQHVPRLSVRCDVRLLVDRGAERGARGRAGRRCRR